MKYSVIVCTNGVFKIQAECTEWEVALVNFHSTCTTLWNAPDVEKAAVVVVDEKFRTYKMELIKYTEE